MTLSELEHSDGDFLKIGDVAKYLHASPQKIREQARNGSLLCMGIYWIGNRIKISKQAFVRYHKYGSTIISKGSDLYIKADI